MTPLVNQLGILLVLSVGIGVPAGVIWAAVNYYRDNKALKDSLED